MIRRQVLAPPCCWRAGRFERCCNGRRGQSSPARLIRAILQLHMHPALSGPSEQGCWDTETPDESAAQSPWGIAFLHAKTCPGGINFLSHPLPFSFSTSAGRPMHSHHPLFIYFTKWWPFICVLGASFGAIHLISWNSTFPDPLRAVALALKRTYFHHHVHHLHAIRDRIPPMGRPAYDSPRFCPDSLHHQPCRDDGGGLCSFEGQCLATRTTRMRFGIIGFVFFDMLQNRDGTALAIIRTSGPPMNQGAQTSVKTRPPIGN